MKALKFKSYKEYDNVETIPQLKETLKEFLLNIEQPFEHCGPQNKLIEELEFRSRSGFFAFDHNRGGFDLLFITNIGSLIGSGEHMGLKIEKRVTADYNLHYNDIKENNPQLNEENGNNLDKLYELIDRVTYDDYSGIAWRVRIMYEGSGILKLYAGYDFDAPDFRWNNAADFETEIKFKTLTGLKSQLKKLIKTIEKSQ